MTKRMTTWRAMTAIVVLVASGCSVDADHDAIATAKRHLSDRKYQEAVIVLKSALQKNDQLAEARYLLGTALLEQRDGAGAMFELQRAQALGLDSDQLTAKLARTLVATGKSKEAVEKYGTTSLKDPKAQAELLTALAGAYIKLGRLEQAESAVNAALAADPGHMWAMLTKASLLAAAKNFDAALAMIDKAIAAGGTRGEGYLYKGHLLDFTGRDPAAAAEAFRLAAQDPGQTLPARAALIQLHLKQHQVPKAKEELAALAQTHRDNGMTRYLDAIVSFSSKEYERTESIIGQLLRAAPDNPSLLTLGAAANMQRGSYVAAESKLGKVVASVESAHLARKMLAETYVYMGQADKGLTVLKPLLDRAQPDPEVLALAGELRLRQGDVNRAEELFMRAASARPDSARFQTALALTEIVRGNAEAGFDSLRTIAGKDSSDLADLALISATMQRREYDKALKAIDALDKKLPGRAVTSHLRGRALLAKGEAVAAKAAFAAAVGIDANHVAATIALAGVEESEDQAQAALQRLEAAVKRNPKNTPLRMAQLELMARQGAKPADLHAAIDDAIRASPGDAEPRVAKIMQHSREGDSKSAALVAQQALSALPNEPLVLEAAARALASAGDTQQALSALQRLASAAPKSEIPHLLAADVHARAGNAAQAATSLSRAFDVAPMSGEVHRRLVVQAKRTNNYRAVLDAAKLLQTRHPTLAPGFLLEGDAEWSRKAWPKAIAAYRSALEKTGAGARPQQILYSRLIASGDKGTAEQFAGDWLKRHPGDIDFLEHIAAATLLRGEHALAEKRYRDALALAPNSPVIHNNLAWLMAERGAAGAVAMAERALTLSPGAPTVLDTLAKALAAEGKIDKAILSQERAVKKAPDRLEYRLALARLYLKAGDKAKAQTEIDIIEKSSGALKGSADFVDLKKAARS